MNESELGELWTAIIRYEFLRGRYLRVRVPCSSPVRAKWLCERIGGYVDGGSVMAQGRKIAGVLRTLGQREEIVAAAVAYGYLRGEPAARAGEELLRLAEGD